MLKTYFIYSEKENGKDVYLVNEVKTSLSFQALGLFISQNLSQAKDVKSLLNLNLNISYLGPDAPDQNIKNLKNTNVFYKKYVPQETMVFDSKSALNDFFHENVKDAIFWYNSNKKTWLVNSYHHIIPITWYHNFFSTMQFFHLDYINDLKLASQKKLNTDEIISVYEKHLYHKCNNEKMLAKLHKLWAYHVEGKGLGYLSINYNPSDYDHMNYAVEKRRLESKMIPIIEENKVAKIKI